jgi:hypothetical protein
MPLVALPSDYTGDKVTMLLNQAWDMIQGPRGTNQPLTPVSSTLVEEFGKRYCNKQPSGNVVIEPRYLPIISVTSLKWSYNINQNGWTSSTNFDIQGDQIQAYDFPFSRSEWGMIQLIYTSGLSTIPDALKMACGLMAAHLFSGTMFPTQTGSSVLPGWLPQDVSLLIEKFKRVR